MKKKLKPKTSFSKKIYSNLKRCKQKYYKQSLIYWNLYNNHNYKIKIREKRVEQSLLRS